VVVVGGGIIYNPMANSAFPFSSTSPFACWVGGFCSSSSSSSCTVLMMTMMAAAESNVCVHHHHLFGVSLPMELTLHVLSFLEPPHLLQLGLCSRFCHALANDDSCAFALLGQLPPWALPHLLLLLLLPPPPLHSTGSGGSST